MANLIKSFLTKSDLDAVAEAIGVAEKRTAGEVRVSVRQRRSRKEKGLSVEELARREFVSLGMRKTRDRTGILVFILLETREFFILADEHINEKVREERWREIAGGMARSFADGAYRAGLITAVQSVGEELARFFPIKPDDTNELPNEVRIS